MAKSKIKTKKTRTPVPAEIEQQIKAQAGGRCSVPRCVSVAELVIHHIDGNPSNHEPDNLLLLCAGCHSRTNTGEIDRKSCKAIKRDVVVRTAPADELQHIREGVATDIYQLVGMEDEARPLAVDGKGNRVLDLRLEAAASQAMAFEKANLRLPIGILHALVLELHKAAAFQSALQIQQAIMNDEGITAVDHFNLGVLLDKAGSDGDATAAFGAAMDAVAGDADALCSLAAHLHDADRKEAEDAYRKAVEADPKDGQWLNSLAYYLWENGRSEEAEVEARKALDIDPNESYANATLGLLLFEKDDLEGGRAGYKKAIELNSDDMPLLQRFHFEYGRALGRNGQVEEARREFIAAAKVNAKYITREMIEDELAQLEAGG